MNILVVDDEPVSQKTLSILLSDYGYVDVADNGVVGFDFFVNAQKKGSRYDLVCIDIEMPRMNGIEMLEKMRALEKLLGIPPHRAVKAMMVTVHDDPKSILSSFDKQCDSFIVKPLNRIGIQKQLADLGFRKSETFVA